MPVLNLKPRGERGSLSGFGLFFFVVVASRVVCRQVLALKEMLATEVAVLVVCPVVVPQVGRLACFQRHALKHCVQAVRRLTNSSCVISWAYGHVSSVTATSMEFLRGWPVDARASAGDSIPIEQVGAASSSFRFASMAYSELVFKRACVSF